VDCPWHLYAHSIRPRRFCLEIVKHKLQIFDLLLERATVDRSRCFPESQVAATACDILCLLLQWPGHIVPGLPDSADMTSYRHDRKTLSQIMAVLTSRQGWQEKLINVRRHIEEEDMDKIETYFSNAVIHHDTLGPPSELNATRLFTQRGICRVVIL